MKEKQRLAGVDFVKLLAVLFVISIHAIAYLDILSPDMRGVRMFLLVTLRYFVMSCVPLFLLITGFLRGRKTANRKFYAGLIPILTSYLFLATVTVMYDMHEDPSLTWGAAVISILHFSAIGYAWYLKMFLGVFLLIPFLNKGYASLEQKKSKLCLLAVMVGISVLPSITTIFKNEMHAFDIIPDYWTVLYPFTYYLLGVFIAEYRPRYNRLLCLLTAFLGAAGAAVAVFIQSGGSAFAWWVLNGFDSMSAMLVTLGVFLAFYDLEIRNKAARFVCSAVAASSLDIFLISYLIERIVYPMTGTFPFRLPVMILAIFTLSFIAAKIKQFLFFAVKWSWKTAVGRKAAE